MTATQILDEAGLASATKGAQFLLFKHSLSCPISAHAFREYVSFANKATNVPSAWIEVVSQRSLSKRIEKETGVTHESPQALLFRKGSVVWHASHDAITEASLVDAVRALMLSGD